MYEGAPTWTNAWLGVSQPDCPLRREDGTQIRKNREKSFGLMQRIISTWCARSGLIYDMSAGTLTTAAAQCSIGSRTCISIDKDPECIRRGEDRLRRMSSVSTKNTCRL